MNWLDVYPSHALDAAVSTRALQKPLVSASTPSHHRFPFRWVTQPRGDANPVVLTKLLDVVRSVAADVEREYGAARVLTNLGRYQDAKHLHFHVASGDAIRR